LVTYLKIPYHIYGKSQIKNLNHKMKRKFTFPLQHSKNFVRLALVVDILFKTSSLFLFIYVGERFRSVSIAKVHRLSNTYV